MRARSQNIVIHLLGIKSNSKNAKSSLEYFSLFTDETIINLLTRYTNIHIENNK